MKYPQMTKLIETLQAKTVSGELAWEQTEKADYFQVAFSTGAVRIGPKTGAAGVDMVISFYNENGDLIEEVTDVSLRGDVTTPFTTLSEIHSGARRRAMGVDKALDALLAEMESASQSGKGR